MIGNRFIVLILSAFIIGTLLLIGIQYNSSQNINQLIDGNEKLLTELRLSSHLREMERDMYWVESRIRGAIATSDISHLSEVDEKISQIEAYLDTLRAMDKDKTVIQYIDRLHVIAENKRSTKDLLLFRYKHTGKMDDTTLISNPHAREVSNEISMATRRIYNSRQQLMTQLSDSIEESSKRVRTWGGILIAFIVVSASGWFWFIVNRIRRQNQLIVKLDESEKKAREAARVKENFLANMSHEIRTPLNAILGFTNLLKSHKQDAAQADFTDSIQKAGENLLSIVNDILDLSKIEAGMVRIEANPFSVRGLVHSVETLFGERMREKGLVLQTDIEASVPDTLIGDATRLTQILVNLLGNALKFTEKGHISVRVITKSATDTTIRLGFSIRDTGIGIDTKKLAAIFERFQQAEDSTTRNYGGTGLGLSIVKELIEIQGGEISVESEVGKGTTFYFCIPYQISAEQFTAPQPRDVIYSESTELTQAHLLLVDDNTMNQSLIKHLLNQWKLSYDVASNGVEALAYLQDRKYDLVLMDIQMPRMDGYTTSQHIRGELKLDVPIIAMTAHAMAGEREKCLSYGMNEYLSKPVREQDLYGLINQFLITDKNSQTAPDSINIVSHTYSCIDLQYLSEISKGDKEYEKMMTLQFLEILPKELEIIESSLIKKDFAIVRRVAHNMKTTVSIMGLTDQLGDYLTALEENMGDEEQQLAHVTILKQICTQALEEANHFYQSLS
ncbi:ATP-binding protein [Xanthocytophaga agilis]|uniref:histidine kinase n=1 Tax=Xanthocytophaga agilis TaxID=3048010 RepID=A0AAE3RAD7_9BACT|nr:ATP-binding protein [Xanthocytophaga agilis]MDJ1504319.1 ATP-binding protein [Xanthocytophaga agilis]